MDELLDRAALERLIGQRDRDHDAILGPEILRNVAFPRSVLDQVDVPRPHHDLLTPGQLKFGAALQGDDVLPLRPGVPVPAGRRGRALNCAPVTLSIL